MPKDEPPLHPRPLPTVAFLFTLRRERHPLNRAWNTFFKGCPPRTHRIHVHADPSFKGPKGNRTLQQQQAALQGAFANTTIPPPHVHIARFGYSMVAARMLLLRHAVAVSPPSDWFIFLSESDAPLRSCAEAARYLASKGGRSFVYADPPFAAQRRGAEAWAQTFRSRCPLCEAANISADDYRHGPGWVGLHRAQALPILARERELEKLFATTEGLGVPDEWYWSTLVQAQGGRRFNHSLTYMEPGDPKTGHSQMFGPDDLPRLVAAARGGRLQSFFARKFPTTPQMDLALVSSLLASRGGSNASARRHVGTRAAV